MARILILDDNASALDIFDIYFSRHHHQVLGVRDLKDLQWNVTQFQPQLILLDLGGVDGVQASQLLRQMPAPFRHIALVVLSAFDEGVVTALNLDVDGYISKTESLANILIQVNHFITVAHQSEIASCVAHQGVDAEHDAVLSISGSEDITDEPQALDPSALASLVRDLSVDVIADIVAVLIEDMHQRGKLIAQAVDAWDVGQIAEQVHALKPSAMTYGARRLLALCQHFENAHRSNRVNAMREAAGQLVSVLLQTEAALVEHMNLPCHPGCAPQVSRGRQA